MGHRWSSPLKHRGECASSASEGEGHANERVSRAARAGFRCDDDRADDGAGPLGDEYRSLAAFEMMGTLGTGTVGRVHLARHRTSGSFFALKAMRKADVVRLGQVGPSIRETRRLQCTLPDDPNAYKSLGDQVVEPKQWCGPAPGAGPPKRFTAQTVALILRTNHRATQSLNHRSNRCL